MQFDRLETPCYVVDEGLITQNLEILKSVADNTGCRVLLAQKAFSMFELYPLIGRYLHGAASSGLFEARLGAEFMKKENHVFSPGYRDDQFDEICGYCGHIIFNSFTQLEKFGPRARAAGRSVGLRINPELSTQDGGIYDPCAPFSRLGITAARFEKFELPDYVEGLHFHTLCEQDSDALAETFAAVEQKFGKYLAKMKWLNLGGGHHITRPGYNIERLEKLIKEIIEKYGVTVYLEPGEAIALNAGFLVTTVLDVINNGMDIAILDTSAACHMPDVLEMPYTPRVRGGVFSSPLTGAGMPGEKPYTYRLTAPTCLAGDVIGDYSFDAPLKTGGRLVFEDMAIYSMVKNNTFNGMPLPDIVLRAAGGECRVVRRFGYEDFKMRLS